MSCQSTFDYRADFNLFLPACLPDDFVVPCPLSCFQLDSNISGPVQTPYFLHWSIETAQNASSEWWGGTWASAIHNIQNIDSPPPLYSCTGPQRNEKDGQHAKHTQRVSLRLRNWLLRLEKWDISHLIRSLSSSRRHLKKLERSRWKQMKSLLLKRCVCWANAYFYTSASLGLFKSGLIHDIMWTNYRARLSGKKRLISMHYMRERGSRSRFRKRCRFFLLAFSDFVRLLKSKSPLTKSYIPTLIQISIKSE